MGISYFKKPSAVVDAAPATEGRVSLTKGKTITLTKNGTPIVAQNGWGDKSKDYDLKGLVRFKNGRLVYVGAANKDEVLVTADGAIRHHGDVKKGSTEKEKITISWHPDIASVALSSYSAIENGAGSFQKYRVYVEIQNGAQVVSIAAEDTSAADTSYTMLFGEILFGDNGQLSVVNREDYSSPGSENRVGYVGDRVEMDRGPRGQVKS